MREMAERDGEGAERMYIRERERERERERVAEKSYLMKDTLIS